jgi:hypothetical protein
METTKNNPLDALVNDMTKILDKNLGTNAFAFARCNLITDSKYFRRTNLYYDATSLHAVYKCLVDGKTYDVSIKPLT